MKRITNYKNLFDITGEIELKPLKKSYRDKMKTWHPDKFSDNPEGLKEAEVKSQEIIGAYEFLVGIAPETQEANLEEYTKTTTEAGVADFNYKKQVLEVSFADGSVYEYYGVPKSVYAKMINSNTLNRFGRRHIFSSYIHRRTKKVVEQEESQEK